MFNIVLYQPEIPPNTGNIIRLCANTGCTLHLIEPLGFDITDKHLKRAGLDHIMKVPLKRYASFSQYLESINISEQLIDSNSSVNSDNSNNQHNRIFLCSTKANKLYNNTQFKPHDTFVFGPETRGLPMSILDSFPNEQKIKIPMLADSRSLNLSNSVAVIIYEAWRQIEFSKR